MGRNYPDCSQPTAVVVTHLPGWVSSQFNWYTRRAVLAGIYNTTELVMMQDSSPDFEDTWRFLENRINDAMNMGHTAKQVEGGQPFGKPPHWAHCLLEPQLDTRIFSYSPSASADSPKGLPREPGWLSLIPALPEALPFAHLAHLWSCCPQALPLVPKALLTTRWG